ncbi:MAG: BsaWI family type II restriction enzyme [Candidatus Poribacteria bacterium]|nr:BsaWI family type II restriction enzyme [Candidatus Poribacteria bacterium]
MKKRRGEEAYKYMHELLDEAKELRYAYLTANHPKKDKGQSWRSFKGKHFQKLIQYIITDSIEILGFKVVNGDKLENTNTQNLSQELRQVKENLVIYYGEFGVRLPDADIVIYNPEDSHVIAIVSSKTSLRERIAQTSYWKFKLLANEDTKHIKVYLITPDTDKLLTKADPARKERIIAEAELDGTYVLTKEDLQENENVKLFEHFIEDFKKVIEETQ